MFKKYQLKNGLTVLLVQNRKSPVVSVQMWVRTGSADEAPRVRGISHFIEHLVFKGTRSYGVGEIAAKVEGSGGEINAYTSFDQTVFYVTISSHFKEIGIQTISEMMGFPTFDESEIDAEREVVIEEIRRGQDSPHRQASRLLFGSMYKTHPYGEPVIGYDSVIRRVTKKEITQYYRDRYSPANMTLLVVGDFDFAEMKEMIHSHFAEIERTPVRKVKRPKEQPRKAPKLAYGPSEFEQTFMFWSWPVPSADHADALPLEVLALIVGQGDSSRLVQNLRLDKNIVQSVGASSFLAKNPGFFAFSATLPPENISLVQEEFKREWVRIVTEPPHEDEFEKAMINFRSEQYYALETVDGMARKYGHYEDLFGDHKMFQAQMKALDKLKPNDLLKVARKYLKPEALCVSVLGRGIQAQVKNKIRKAMPRVMPKSQPGKSTTKRKVRKLTWVPKVSSKDLGRAQIPEKVMTGGTPLLFRPSFDTPVLSVKLGFLGGSRMESSMRYGLNELAVRSWVGSTRKKTEREVLQLIDANASSLSSFGGRNTIGLQVGSLHPFSDDMLDLMEEVLFDFQISESVLSREREQMLEQIRTRKDNPAQEAMLSGIKALFGDHPMGRDPLGTPETLRMVGVAEAEEHIRASIMKQNMAIAACGHLSADHMFKRFHRLLDKIPHGEKRVPAPPPRSLQKSVQIFSQSKKEQSHIVMLFQGLSLDHMDRFGLQLIEAILAGQGGRLFIRLRDKASLAYSVAPLRMEGVGAGYFGAYIGCAPEKGEKALSMLREEFNQLSQERVSDDELNRAKQYLLGRHDIDLQRNSSIATSMLFDELYGLDFADLFRYRTYIESVTTEHIQRIARDIFTGPQVVSCVGARPPWP